jgi:hypothetical protein
MRIAVVVTTYNRPDALDAVLGAYAHQSDTAFELIVADDGSTAETTKLVRRFAARAPFEVSHVWQEDQGFRAAAIRNRAVAAARAEYIIFTDGDCVRRAPSYQHRRLAEPGWFLAGNRVLLSERFTRAALDEHLPLHDWTWADWVRARGRGEANRVMPLVHLPDGAFPSAARTWEGVKVTCQPGVRSHASTAWTNPIPAGVGGLRSRDSAARPGAAQECSLCRTGVPSLAQRARPHPSAGEPEAPAELCTRAERERRSVSIGICRSGTRVSTQ